ILGTEFVASYDRSATANREAWAAPGAVDAVLQSPDGPVPATARLTAHTVELVVHGWDVAEASEQTPTFDDDVVQAATEFAHANMPPERDGQFFAEIRDFASSASSIDQLAAF